MEHDVERMEFQQVFQPSRKSRALIIRFSKFVTLHRVSKNGAGRDKSISNKIAMNLQFKFFIPRFERLMMV